MSHIKGDIPNNVYHYTSPQGIFDILRNKTLWFTDVQYLNDKSEYIAPSDDKYRYVLSTSLNSDSIAMWNHYVKNNGYSGYNLGLKHNVLIQYLADAVYNTNCATLEDRKHMGLKYDEITCEYSKVEYELNEDKSDLFKKLKGFSSEEEYRFVLVVPKEYPLANSCSDNDEIELLQKYRVGNSGIITPYLEWRFDIHKKRQLFSQITLAPMIEAKLAKKSFERFLDKSLGCSIKITPSRIRMRF